VGGLCTDATGAAARTGCALQLYLAGWRLGGQQTLQHRPPDSPTADLSPDSAGKSSSSSWICRGSSQSEREDGVSWLEERPVYARRDLVRIAKRLAKGARAATSEGAAGAEAMMGGETPSDTKLELPPPRKLVLSHPGWRSDDTKVFEKDRGKEGNTHTHTHSSFFGKVVSLML
jgi:hypothetical protein